MRVDVAFRAPHARKHGTTFSESWTSADGSTIVAVGAVIAGGDRVVVSDLLRTGARALVTSRKALATALVALDRVVQRHGREQRDGELAAAVILFAIPKAGSDLDVAGAGQLHAALVDGNGAHHALHAHAAALGTGLDAHAVVTVHLRRDDLAVAATIPIERAWWEAGDRSAGALIHRGSEQDAAAAIIALA